MRARLLLLAAALAAFGASLGSGFHFDDYAIFSDPVLTSPLGVAAVWGWRQTRPLTYLTFWLNYQAGGQRPARVPRPEPAAASGRGAAGLRVPAAASARARGAGGGGAVRGAPAAGRSGGLRVGPQHRAGGAACFAALLAGLRAGRGWPWRWFAAALLAKEECAAFPLVLAMLPAGEAARPVADRRHARPGRGGGGARDLCRRGHAGAPAGLHAGISPWKYWLAQGPVILRYLRLLIVPYGFTVDADIHVPPVWLGVLAWAGMAAVGGVCGAIGGIPAPCGCWRG